nr:MAG TPA: hypothetical protein [Caudoviricetes sp.]
MRVFGLFTRCACFLRIGEKLPNSSNLPCKPALVYACLIKTERLAGFVICC